MGKKIRIRHASGSSIIEIPSSADAKCTNADVARLIESTEPSLLMKKQIWKVGYPPKLSPERSADDDFPINDVDIIHVSLSSSSESKPTLNFPPSKNDETEVVTIEKYSEPPLTDGNDAGIKIVRRVMDADNSCLFNSIGYVLLNKSRSDSTKLRQMVAKAVIDDPMTFTEAFLGKSPSDYVNFITNSKAWGGQIELLIFSRLFHTEIAAFDIIRNRVDIYGTENEYNRRVFVIYDGIHYDALTLSFCLDESTMAPEEMDVLQFSPKDEIAVNMAKSLCADQHRKKQFTDTSNFTLRCVICQVGLKGATEAQKHAEATGHQNFAEFQ